MSDAGQAARSSAPVALEWSEVRAYLKAHALLIREDAELLDELGLRINAANVVEFGPAALARQVAARVRETNARQRLESTARSNFAAQAQTHAAVIELLGARNNADLARRLDEMAKLRFGLVTGVLALEGPGGAPAGWRTLPEGGVDAVLGAEGQTWMGAPVKALELFGLQTHLVRSMAAVRIALWAPSREGLVVFGSSEPDAFTPDMGCELVSFLARVAERTAERWPIL